MLHSCSSRIMLAAALLAATQASIAEADISEHGAKSKHQRLRHIEEMTITARKREENLLQVPISVSVFNAEQLASPTLDDIASLNAFTPNMEFSSSPPISGTSNAAAVFIRGIGQNDFLATNDPGVGIYLDGVYLARSVGSVLKLNDIERIEILRGPQGTLFGKNTIGGAVNVISKAPSDSFAAAINLTVGDANRQDWHLSMEGPLTSSLAGRITLLDEQRDGYIKRIFDGSDQGDISRQTVKAVLAWQPTDSASLRLGIDHTHQRQNGAPEVLINIAESRSTDELAGISPALWASYETLNQLIAPQFNTQWDDRWVPSNRSSSYATGPSQDDVDVTGVSLLGEFDLSDNVVLTTVTGFRAMEGLYGRDADGSPLNYGHLITRDEQSQYSQEWRLSGDIGSDITWTAGIFYFNEDIDNQQDVIILEGLFEATGGMADATFNVTNKIETQNAALFGQATWAITDTLSVTGGLRTGREEKTFFIDIFTINNNRQIIGPAEQPTDVWTETTPMLSIDYQAAENHLLYTTYSEGFKSGGYNGRSINPVIDANTNQPIIDRFDPEFAKSLELGWKYQADNMYLQAAVFSTNYTNLQTSVLTQGAGNIIAPTIDNAAKATISGAELEINLNPSDAFTIRTSLGYLDAEYDDIDANSLLDKNLKLQKIPEWNASVQSSYVWMLQRYGELSFSADASYKGKVYNDPLNDEEIAQPATTLVNASLTWDSPAEKWRVVGFVTNLTDEVVFLSGADALDSFGTKGVTYSRERELGFSITSRID